MRTNFILYPKFLISDLWLLYGWISVTQMAVTWGSPVIVVIALRYFKWTQLGGLNKLMFTSTYRGWYSVTLLFLIQQYYQLKKMQKILMGTRMQWKLYCKCPYCKNWFLYPHVSINSPECTRNELFPRRKFILFNMIFSLNSVIVNWLLLYYNVI